MKPYYILSIDGGGVRGLISAIWLNRLQERLSEPLQTYFNLISGTSSGSIIACGLAAGLDTQTLVDLLLNDAQTMFPSSNTNTWKQIGWLFRDPYQHPIYDGTAMEGFLKRVFGAMRFCELPIKPTLVTSYDMLNRRPVLFNNTNPEHANLPVWEVCKASTAIPTYFPAHVVSLNEQPIPCIDGAFTSKNPTIGAIAEAIKASKRTEQPIRIEQMVVASFGVGHLKPQVSAAQARRWRALASAVPLVHALIEGPTDLTDYVVEQMLPIHHYFRFQTTLAIEDEVGNTDPAHLKILVDAAEDYTNQKEGRAKLEQLAQCLQQDREPYRVNIYLPVQQIFEPETVQRTKQEIIGNQMSRSIAYSSELNILESTLWEPITPESTFSIPIGNTANNTQADIQEHPGRTDCSLSPVFQTIKSFSKVGLFGIASLIMFAGVSGRNWFPHFSLSEAQPSLATTHLSSPVNALPVEVLSIQAEQSYSVQRSYTGTIGSRRTSKLGFERSGQLVNVTVKAGDRVEAGEILASLDTQSLHLQAQELQAQQTQATAQFNELQAGVRSETIAAARAVVRRLQEQLKLAQNQYARRQTLYHQGAISLEQLDEAASQANTLQAQVDEANSQLQALLTGTRPEQLQAQAALIEQLIARQENLAVERDKSDLRAPFSGVISERLADEGTVLSAGQPILYLVEEGALEARIGVPKAATEHLPLGSSQQVRVGETAYPAQVTAILPEVDSSTHTVTVVLQVEAATAAISPGQTAQLQLTETIPARGYWLPTTALAAAGRGLWSCYVLGDPLWLETTPAFPVEPQIIEVLHTEGDRVFVRGTLQPGDRVILNGTHRLTRGQLVTVQ